MDELEQEWPRITVPSCRILSPDLARGVAVIIVPACPDIDNLKVGMEIVGGNAAGLTRDKNPIISDIESINATDRASGVRITVSCISTNTDEVVCDLVFAELPPFKQAEHVRITNKSWTTSDPAKPVIDFGQVVVNLKKSLGESAPEDIHVSQRCISVDLRPEFVDGKMSGNFYHGDHGAEGGLVHRRGSGTAPSKTDGGEHTFYVEWDDTLTEAREDGSIITSKDSDHYVDEIYGRDLFDVKHKRLSLWVDRTKVSSYYVNKLKISGVADSAKHLWPDEVLTDPVLVTNDDMTASQALLKVAGMVADVAIIYGGVTGVTEGLLATKAAGLTYAGAKTLASTLVNAKFAQTMVGSGEGMVDQLLGQTADGKPNATDMIWGYNPSIGEEEDVTIETQLATGIAAGFSTQRLAHSYGAENPLEKDYDPEKFWGGDHRLGTVTINGSLFAHGGVACQAGSEGTPSTKFKWSVDYVAGISGGYNGLRFWINDKCEVVLLNKDGIIDQKFNDPTDARNRYIIK